MTVCKETDTIKVPFTLFGTETVSGEITGYVTKSEQHPKNYMLFYKIVPFIDGCDEGTKTFIHNYRDPRPEMVLIECEHSDREYSMKEHRWVCYQPRADGVTVVDENEIAGQVSSVKGYCDSLKDAYDAFGQLLIGEHIHHAEAAVFEKRIDNTSKRASLSMTQVHV